MAKVSFNKLGLTKEIPSVTFEWNNQIIEVKQYLSLDTKLELIENIINTTVDEHNYYNPCKLDVHTNIFMIEAYTNITFTEKQKEDISKLYDSFKFSGLMTKIMETIPDEEIDYIIKSVNDTIQSVYAYKNSAMGILEALKQDYSNVNFDMDAINQVLQNNPENFAFLKEVMEKLG